MEIALKIKTCILQHENSPKNVCNLKHGNWFTKQAGNLHFGNSWKENKTCNFQHGNSYKNQACYLLHGNSLKISGW